MKQELAWGTAAAVAIVAAVGISSQPGGKPDTSPSAGKQKGQTIVTTSATKEAEAGRDFQPQCADSIPLLEHFFLHEKITGPPSCYQRQPVPTPLDSKCQTEFVIATLPDPIHTHSSLLFDRLVEAIQEGAQDEDYEYDSSWLPWETQESSFLFLKDQDDAEGRKERREAQPGILLFRATSDGSGHSPYERALIVFVVGEDSTSGIHRPQFENAVAWIKALQQPSDKRTSVAVLGPTFSGSFVSLADLLSKTHGVSSLNAGEGFSVYSGSASGQNEGLIFANQTGIRFRSLVQDDTTALEWACRYFGQPVLAILSEDETAYGSIVARSNFGSDPQYFARSCGKNALNIFYPRDISTLRAAYQNQSMFTSGSGETNSDNGPRKSLPTDLADPEGQQHDTVRRYAGNQTPLSQEAQLMGIVDVLRTHHAEYVVIRSSSTLDPLFLANFLRRDYPEARILILNSDLLFQRGQDAMGLSGVMTLSTYPMFSRAREWTALPFPGPHSHRSFPENSTEGTYIASRLLLQTLARTNGRTPQLSCEFADKELALQDQQIFAPPLRCEPKSPRTLASLPDYAPPFWTDPHACELTSPDRSCRPAMWLSVITRNGTSPLAALNERTLPMSNSNVGVSVQSADADEHGRAPRISRSAKLLWVTLCSLAVFHFLCCWFASFTAKPAFRAHFASSDDRNTWLVLIGSYVITLMALFAGWGSGMFSPVPSPPAKNWQVMLLVVFVCVMSAAAIVVNIVTTRRLNPNVTLKPGFKWRMITSLGLFGGSIVGFFLFWVRPIEGGLRLASRAFVYFRCMHLTSGVSPLVPFLSLAAGLYVWFWYALHGLALFGPDRPRLPQLNNLIVKFPPETVKEGQPAELKLSMFSYDRVAKPAEKAAKPLAWINVIVTAVVFVLVGALLFGLGRGVPIRSLGSTSTYATIFFVALVFYSSFILSETWKVRRTWTSVRQLLVFLDRLTLRRTLSAMHGFSWGNVWRMSGNVLDVRYKLLSRQLECLHHLHNCLTSPEGALFDGLDTSEESVRESLEASREFADWYSNNYDNPNAAGLDKFQALQEQVAQTTGVVLTELLVPATRTETQSLIQVDPDDDCDDDRISPPQSEDALIRNAEELICLTYLGYAQNLLGRIRTIVLGGICLFIALSIAVSSYPFDPRTLLSAILLLLFVTFGGIVIFTYADMHRDTTLSHLTNTKPGELGAEFWFKIVGFGAAPLLGLITQVFPEWSGFLFSWLQPGLSSLR